MKALLTEISGCKICKDFLPFAPRPVLRAGRNAKILIVGQAPGLKVQQSGIPWDDLSGKELRLWLNVSKEQFYDTNLFAIVPMGFCYPGKGKTGDLPPRKECAIAWHEKLLNAMPDLQLTLLIGQYAQAYYLKGTVKENLTETVRHFKEYLPTYLPMPHPSPRNNIWKRKNEWFTDEVLPELRAHVRRILG